MTGSLAVLVLLHLTPNFRADATMSGPAEARTTAEVVACAEKEDLRGGLRSEPYVSSAEYRGRDRKAFVAWYNPYSGKAACHVYLYVHDDKKGVWVRQLASVFHGTPRVSVEFGDSITLRDAKGKVIHQYPGE